jgi:prevent-host-death family protein
MFMTVSIDEAKAHLAELLERVKAGEEIVITRAGKPVARLTAYEPQAKHPVLGAARGQIWISPDFDAPLRGAGLDESEK